MNQSVINSACRHPERRQGDRRRSAVGLSLRGLVMGRRRSPRRHGDHHNYYVDWYETKLFAVVLAIFILNCLDALFTLTLLSKGGEEINLLMAALLEISTEAFVNVKLSVTAIALIFLVFHSAVRLIGFFRVRHLLYGILGNYFALFVYELNLLARAL
jgi:hypothetical protein